VLLVVGATAGSAALSAPRPPAPHAVRCLELCSGRHKAAVGARIRITGRRLGRVTEVDFRGKSAYVPAAPVAVRRHRIEVEVPKHARTGRPRVVRSDGHRFAAAEVLRIVPVRRLPGPADFNLLAAAVRPRKSFVDGGRHITLRYRFRARGAVDVKVRLVRNGRLARAWVQRSRLPYATHRLRWNGTLSPGRAAPPGRYRFKLKRPGHRSHSSDRFRVRYGKFPVRGPHGYGGPVQRFGAPRSGGRVHQGQDVFASCGTPVVAARGGRVQARGSDPVLYGNWVVIDGRATKTDYRYAHFLHPASVHDGDRVRTGDRIGRIGKTGNARTVGCMLHFEVWPRGWLKGGPVDPLPILRRWDRWS
jgi:murein DD-endopeptidase MepM/ murein hydrolase activator NlpD